MSGGRCDLCGEWYSAEDGGCGCWAEAHEQLGAWVPERVQTANGERFVCEAAHLHHGMAEACVCDLERARHAA